MRITEITVDSFGHWKGLRVPNVSSGVTVVYGPNEAGKSTLLQLIRAVLYGFSPQHHHRFVPALYEGRVGGTLHVSAPNGRFEVRRWLPKSGQLEEHENSDLSVRSVDGSLKGRHLLASLLAGVDQAIFQNVFAVGLSEMQYLGTLSDTEAAHQLYGLASGADRVSISEVSRQLEAARDRLLHDPDAVAAIGQLAERKADFHREAVRKVAPTDRWFKLNEERQRITAELQDLERRKDGFGKHIDGINPNQAIRTQWKKCQKLQKQLEAIGPVPDVPATALSRLSKLTMEIASLRKQWEALRKQRKELKQNARGVRGKLGLLRHAEPIDGLKLKGPLLIQTLEKIEKQSVKLEEFEFELQAEMERLGIKADWSVGSLPVITNNMIDSLRQPARAAWNARQQLQSIDQQCQASLDKAQEFQQQLDGVLEGTSFRTVTEFLDQTRQTANQLQDRIDSDNQLAKLKRNQKEAREDASYWTQRQVLPWKGLMFLGAIFALGATVALTALFGKTFGVDADERLMMAAIGGAISFGAIVIKNVASFAASKSLQSCHHELDELGEQIEQAEGQIKALEEALPVSSEPFVVTLQNKQDELTRLQKLEPMEVQRVAEEQKAEAIASQKQNAEKDLKQARRDWRLRLQTFGLPDTITPNQFKQLSHADGKLAILRKGHAEINESLEQNRREVESHRQRLSLIAERVTFVFEADRLEEQVEELTSALHVARQGREDRETLHRKWRQLGREQEKIARNAKRLTEKKRGLLGRYGGIDTHDFKAIVERQKQALSLKADRDALLVEISQQLGSECTEQELIRQLDDGDFEAKISKLESEHKQVSSRVAKLLERRGELNVQLKNLSKDRQHSVARLEEKQIDEEMKKQVQNWATLAGISRALDAVRTSYESDRQPETLAEASGYLKRLTGGRYRRIWTPFGESSLCVDDEQEKTFRIESLSRGTREQVFLSLRLALAAAYARRGVALPVILDDVFVNFDARRARAAAETVCEFAAAGHQVFVFTCHDHIQDVFRSLDVDVRRLPSVEQVVNEGIAVLPNQPTSTKVEPDPLPVDVLSDEDGADPELDYELMYGAPEYDPGYESPIRQNRSDRGRTTAVWTGPSEPVWN